VVQFVGEVSSAEGKTVENGIFYRVGIVGLAASGLLESRALIESPGWLV
jgi:hypothetical protein